MTSARSSTGQSNGLRNHRLGVRVPPGVFDRFAHCRTFPHQLVVGVHKDEIHRAAVVGVIEGALLGKLIAELWKALVSELKVPRPAGFLIAVGCYLRQ